MNELVSWEHREVPRLVHAYDSWRTMRSWLGDLESMRILIMYILGWET